MFDKLKLDFQQAKMSKKLTYKELQDFNEAMIYITLDFDNEELAYRQDVWHARVAKLL